MSKYIKDFLKCRQPVLQQTVRSIRLGYKGRGVFRGIKGPVLGKMHSECNNIMKVLAARRAKDPNIYYLVNIGLPPSKNSRKQIKEDKRGRSPTITTGSLIEDIYEEWCKTVAPQQIKRIADHYGIFQDLYGDAYFYPEIRLEIAYKLAEEEYVPVYRGNIIKPAEASKKPEVRFEANPDKLYTLVFSNLDGHLNQENGEYIQWFVGNIPEGDVTKGDTIKEYVRPFPTRGTGYHRYAYVLYEQDKPIDYSEYKTEASHRVDLDDRTIKTYDLYKKYQDYMTPAGIAFFQSDWDSTVSDFFHKILNIEEPIFEYDHPELFVKKQKHFPKRMAFNTYLDRYRDPKEIAKELLLERLKTLHPFKKPDPPSKYPDAHTYFDTAHLPRWKQLEIRKRRRGWGIANYYKDMLDPK